MLLQELWYQETVCFPGMPVPTSIQDRRVKVLFPEVHGN